MGLVRHAMPEGMVALPPAGWGRTGIYLGMAAGDGAGRWFTGGLPERGEDWYRDAILAGGRVVNGVPVTEATALMLAGPGGHKSLGWLLGLLGLQDWPGPVLCLSTRTDLARFAGPRRARLGKVQVLDWRGELAKTLPYQRVRWNPLDGCEVPGVAKDRMTVMLETVELGRPPAEAIWSVLAVQALTAWAHAAALEGAGIKRVLGWLRKDELTEPQKIFKAHRSRAGFGEDLAALAGKAEDTKQSILHSARPVLAALADPAVLDGCTPDLIEPAFDIDSFLTSSDTLFITDKGGKSAASPLATLTVALVNALLEKAELNAAATEAGPGRLPGRLSPPLLVVIDEVANVSPLPNLVQVFSQARGHGIAVAVAAQSWSQLTERWGQPGATAIWDTAAYRLVGAGLQDMDFLTDVSKSLGERQVWRPSVGSQSGGSGSSGASHRGKSESHTLVETPNYKASALAALPEGKAMLMGREGARPVQLPALPSLLEAMARAEDREVQRANADVRAALAAPRAVPSWWARLRDAL
ncbi:MAG: TraM recognition domain-containing protein [Candidatus Dormibacteraeota bacterium]|jgi:type IV secretory pathway TraG/TraD family ATPase VirD4|nr:TraM recognition domain-containing protein [Candidatus Dormibacteraeota bacterium]